MSGKGNKGKTGKKKAVASLQTISATARNSSHSSNPSQNASTSTSRPPNLPPTQFPSLNRQVSASRPQSQSQTTPRSVPERSNTPEPSPLSTQRSFQAPAPGSLPVAATQSPSTEPQEDGGPEDLVYEDLPMEEEDGEDGDPDELLQIVLAQPGREKLTRLNKDPIPGVPTIWFGKRDNGKLARVISGIMRRKFEGPYFSWKVTPTHVKERYFRTFASKYYWEAGITDDVKEGFMKVAQRRLKGMVSKAKTSGERPPWIGETLWGRMWSYWRTEAAKLKSSNAADARNSERNGRGKHRHVSGQKSNAQVKEDMEEELGRPVSLGEVFVRTHTRKSDGTFVDEKARQIVEAYESHIGEAMQALGESDAEITEHSSQQSTHRTLTIEEKNEIFLKVTEKDERGTPYGLGQLIDQFGKRKRETSCSSSHSTDEILSQLQAANAKLARHEEENARRDSERKKDQELIESLEMLLSYMKTSDPRFSGFVDAALAARKASNDAAAAITPPNPQGDHSNSPISPADNVDESSGDEEDDDEEDDDEDDGEGDVDV